MDAASNLALHWQPLTGLLIGVLLLGIAGYMNWYVPEKTVVIKWTATHIFGHQLSAEASASGMFSVATSILVAIGWVWTGLALMYLWNG